MNAAKRHAIFSIWRAANPAPKSDLEYASTFELLVSVILSAQATDKGVNAATRKLYAVANTPAAILALGEEGLIPYIATIGLYRAKAKNVIAACHQLLTQHGGQVPATREALEALPGVGRKTANVVLNVAFGEPTIAVDTHNFRVANRTGIAPGKNVDIVERKLIQFVPTEFKLHAHHWLILHGRYVCKAQTPDCPNCTIAHLCEFKPKTQAKAVKPTAANRQALRAAKPIAGSTARKAMPKR
jgi:endonuclease III